MPLPLPLIALALQSAPSLINLITGSEKAEEITEKVVGVAGAVTGLDVSTPDGAQQAVAAINGDPAKMAEWTMRVREVESEELQAVLADRRDARSRDIQLNKMGGNRRANIMLAGAFFTLIACLSAAVWMVFQADLAGTQMQLTFGLLNTVSGFLMKILADAFAFEFGSSRGSKEKSDQIDRLIPSFAAATAKEATKEVSGAFKKMKG